MRIVPLTSGAIAIVDDADWAAVSAHTWCATRPMRDQKIYARSIIAGKSVSLHRFLMNPPDDMTVDHINGLSLDNRRANLRVCTQAQNACNIVTGRKRGGGKHSTFKGVHLVSKRKGGADPKNPYYASITHGGKYRHIGVYKTQEEAARAYDKAARQHHGPFARLNFPDEQDTSPPDALFYGSGDSVCASTNSEPAKRSCG